jgi:DNA-binding SARP family transcriptional activator
MSSLHIHLLGDFLLLAGDNTPVTAFNVPRLQALLAYLLLKRNAPQPRQQLAFLLWPDSTEAQARANLRKLLHQLHQNLPDAERFLHADTQTVQWRPDAPFTLDVADFERALNQAEAAQRAQDRTAELLALRSAVTAYRGDLLPNCYDEWVLPERERLLQAFLGALERLIALLEVARDFGAAIDYAQRLLRHDPLHEATYQLLMRLYAISGDRTVALRTYHTCATILERELGVEPGQAIREAYERLVHPAAPPETRFAPQTMPAEVTTLVGRTQEWEQLQAAWRAATEGRRQVVVLAGEAGIGKTRLAEELRIWVSRQGMATATARCYAAEGELAYAPVTAWLRSEAVYPALPRLDTVWLTEIARLLPELLVERPDLPPPTPLTEDWQRQRFRDALKRAVLCGQQPLLLLIDDLQWCDPETLEWLHFLLRSDPQARLLLVGTVRSEELTEEHPLIPWLIALRRGGQVRDIELAPFDAPTTAVLAAQVLGRALDLPSAAQLYAETEGNPLFVVEMVRAGSGSDPQPRASTMQTVIAARLAQLSPAARDLAQIGATIGRSFTVDVLARASGGDEEMLVRGLDELWQRRIVREQGSDSYDFSHDKIREVAYTELSAARRRLLHRRVAEALEVENTNNLDAVSGQIAMHYERAGQVERATAYYRRAAEVARQIYANAEAIDYSKRALSLLDIQREGKLAADLLERLGDLLELTGQHDDARDAYHRALGSAELDAPVRARLLRKQGVVWTSQGLYSEAQQACETAEAALGLAPSEQDLAWWQEWVQIQIEQMMLHYWQGHATEIGMLVEKTRPIVERYGTPAQRAGFFKGLMLMHFRRDRYVISPDTLSYAQTCLEAQRQTGDLSELAYAQFNVGFAWLWYGDLDAAEREMLAALDLAERIGDVAVQSRCLTYLTVVERKRGQVAVVQEYIGRSLAVAATAQIRQYIGTAKGNLAWIAWHSGNYTEARTRAQEALDLWKQLTVAYGHQWTALWPSIGAALAQNQLDAAIDYTRQLLDPAQQRLSDDLEAILHEALEGWDHGRPQQARERLLRAVELGRAGKPLAEVAFGAGFCDQAHLSREVRALTATTPTALLTKPDARP